MIPIGRPRCLLPAAGLGTRMRPVTRTIPKEILPIGTRPMIQWCITEALEAGFEEVGVVVRREKPLLVEYLEEGTWREGLLPALGERAQRTGIEILEQSEPLGVVDAILTAGRWIEDATPFAVFLPDNVRISGPPPLRVEHLAEAEEIGACLAACHRVGPESRRYFGDVGRIELDDLVPAGERPRVAWLQERRSGAFRAPPEGAWKLMPRYVVTERWLEIARSVRAEARLAGGESDDVTVHRRMVEEARLRAIPWDGTVVDAGNPAGYLYAHHLLHESDAREPPADGEDGESLLEIEF